MEGVLGPLEQLKMDKWYKLLGVAAALGLIAAIGAKNTPFALIMLGVLIFAIGIWKDCKTYFDVAPATLRTPAYTLRLEKFELSISGLLMMVVGIVLAVWGLTKV
jgi:hypothetical protein